MTIKSTRQGLRIRPLRKVDTNFNRLEALKVFIVTRTFKKKKTAVRLTPGSNRETCNPPDLRTRSPSHTTLAQNYRIIKFNKIFKKGGRLAITRKIGIKVNESILTIKTI